MADTKTTLTWLLKDQVSPGVAKIDGKLKGLAATGAGGKNSPLGAIGGAIGSMINPTTLAIAGVGALVGGLSTVIDKAKDHEVVSKRLDAALQANVKGWDGNREAIDKYIGKQTDNGFTVDETTQSLAKLTAATGDVSKAQEFQQAAMDLARLKGISLMDATDAMTKIEAGRFRGLADLGIVLDKGATSTDALAAVQKVAAGQMDAYNGTLQGSFDRVGAKIDDAMTKIGDAVLPVFASIVSFIADNIGPAMDVLGGMFTVVRQVWSIEIAIITAVIKAVVAVISGVIDTIKGAIGWFQSLTRVSDAYKTSHPGTAGMTASQLNTYYHTGGGLAAGGPVEAMTAYTVGENGPETLVMGSASGQVIPNGGSGAPGFTIQGVSESQIIDMVDRGLYFRLQRAAPTLGRT